MSRVPGCGNLGASNLELLGSVTAGRSMNEMKARVETINATPGKKSVWKAFRTTEPCPRTNASPQ